MRSIRFSLTVCFLGLLALSLGGASLMAYRSASSNLEGRLSVQKELAQTQYNDRCRDEENRLDDALLFQAQTLARLVQFHSEWGKLRFLELHTLGLLTSGIGQNAYISAPLWTLNSTRNFAMELMRRNSPVIKFNPAELLTRLDGQVAEFFQIDTAWNASYKSNSLNDLTLPIDMATFSPEEVLHWEFDDKALSEKVKVRRVVLKASRFLFGPTQRIRTPGTGSGRPGEPPLPPRNNNPQEAGFRPAIFIQCAYDLSKRDILFATFALQRDEDILAFAREHKKDLSEFRGRLLAINLIAFLTGGCGCFWLVRLGLAPLNLLTQAVSLINENDFHLNISQQGLPNELKPIAIRLGLTLDQLQKAFLREKQATADISHELRTPLAAMLATIDLALRKNRTPEEYQAMLEDCRQSCKNMRDDVERLLALARLDAGVDLYRPELFDLSHLGADCIKMITPLAQSKEIEIKFESEPNLELNSDPGKLKDILINLLHNAVQYNKPQGTIHLKLSSRPGSIIVLVADTGIGIEPSKKGKIFERFFRIDSARVHGDSTNCGLGLALVKGYAELLGAVIEVQSELGQGSVFKVIFPAMLVNQSLSSTEV